MIVARNCLGCVHCHFAAGWPGTEVTPGDPLEFECRKGHWEVENWDRKPNVVADLDQALKCADWSPEPGHEGDQPAAT